MKKRISAILLIAASVLSLVACRPEGNRRENEGGNEGDPEEIKEEYVENPNWTITYTGREVDTANGVYVVDPIYMKSSDNVDYFLDVISLSSYKREYHSDIKTVIEGIFKSRFVSDWVTNGDSRTPFDALDAGDGDWIALAYEVENGKLGKKYAFCQFKTKAITMRKDESYEISYDGREKYEEDGSAVDVERISVKSFSDYSYYVDIAYPEYITEYYGGDPVNFFNAVLDNQAAMLGEGEDFQDIICSGDQSILFDRLRHGDWTAYAFGVDYLGNLTGNWSELNFDIEEEEATEAFKKWLGTWKIGGKGNGTDSYYYNINVTSAENNQYYAIQDWETGEYAEDFANEWAKDYVFETQFDPQSGKMIFNSQYLGSDSDDEIGDYDVCFLGNIVYDGKQYAITDIDTPIAECTLGADGQSADVKPVKVTVNFDGQKYVSSYVSMQYFDLTDESIYYYNEGVPYFPMTMKKVSEADGSKAPGVLARPKAVRKSIVHATVPTKASTASGTAVRRSADEGQAIRRTMDTNTKASVTKSSVQHRSAATRRAASMSRKAIR